MSYSLIAGLVLPQCFFGLSTVDHATYAHRELFKIEKEGRNNAIVRNQCAYTLQQNRLSSVLPDENQSLVLQSFIMDFGNCVVSTCSSVSHWVLFLSSSRCVASTVSC